MENQTYSTAIDVWAAGCIFAEMIGRKALFPGRDYLHQLRLIIDVIGNPSEEDLACITNEQAVQFLRTLPVKSRKPWSDVFPKAHPQALELLDSMLQFNPAKRCTMEEALNGEYLAPLHQGRKLPMPEVSNCGDVGAGHGHRAGRAALAFASTALRDAWSDALRRTLRCLRLPPPVAWRASVSIGC